MSSTNPGLILYRFFKYHFYNSCHKHCIFNASLLLSKLSSGPYLYFQPHTTQTIFACMIQTKQEGPPFPQTRPTFSHLFALQTAFFLPRMSFSFLLRNLLFSSSFTQFKKLLSSCPLSWNFLGKPSITCTLLTLYLPLFCVQKHSILYYHHFFNLFLLRIGTVL